MSIVSSHHTFDLTELPLPKASCRSGVLISSNAESADRHVQVYPIGFQRYPDKIGIFLAGRQAGDKENCATLSHLRFRLTLINQHNPKASIAAGNPKSSCHGQTVFSRHCVTWLSCKASNMDGLFCESVPEGKPGNNAPACHIRLDEYTMERIACKSPHCLKPADNPVSIPTRIYKIPWSACCTCGDLSRVSLVSNANIPAGFCFS